MNNGGDAAEQVVRLSLDTLQVAVKISGEGAKNIAILLYSIIKGKTQTRGKSRLTNMLKSGKELKVFSIKNEDVKKFQSEAKRYGVLYCVLKDKDDKSKSAIVDVIARAEDASKISRIIDRFNFTSVEDKASIVMQAEKNIENHLKNKGEKPKEKVEQNPPKDEFDDLLDDVLVDDKKDEAQTIPFAKRTEHPLSEKSSESVEQSKTTTTFQINQDRLVIDDFDDFEEIFKPKTKQVNERPSVKEAIKNIRETRAKNQEHLDEIVKDIKPKIKTKER